MDQYCPCEAEKAAHMTAISDVRREWMGVEPTAACAVQPATGFEDRGSHRAPTTPTASEE